MSRIIGYHRPETMDDVLALLTADPNSRLIAGGTDLVLQLRRRRMQEPCALISLRRVRELSRVEFDGEGGVAIGAAVPLWDLERNVQLRETWPAFVEAVSVVGGHQIRQVATLGGNLANASPAADTAVALLAYDANLLLMKQGEQRVVPLHSFFAGPRATILEPNELIAKVLVPRPLKGARAVFMRKGRVQMDLAIASVAIQLSLEHNRVSFARIAVGAVAPTPMRMRRAEELLLREKLSPNLLDTVAASVQEDIAPISDVRSSADYRRDLIGVYMRRALAALLQELPS